MKTIKGDYQHINTGKAVKLSSLIKSDDITDHSIIQIFSAAGAFITKGNWFQDHILDWGDSWGQATKAGTGLTVNFRLA